MNKITGFLKEVYEELTKVTWLGRKDVVRSTVAVSFVVVLISIYISAPAPTRQQEFNIL